MQRYPSARYCSFLRAPHILYYYYCPLSKNNGMFFKPGTHALTAASPRTPTKSPCRTTLMPAYLPSGRGSNLKSSRRRLGSSPVICEPAKGHKVVTRQTYRGGYQAGLLVISPRDHSVSLEARQPQNLGGQVPILHNT